MIKADNRSETTMTRYMNTLLAFAGAACLVGCGEAGAAAPDATAQNEDCETLLARADAQLADGASTSKTRALAASRDMIADLCAAGQDEYAAQLLKSMLPGQEDRKAAEKAAGLERLTADYLQGLWCGVSSSGETGPWQFQEDGSYKVGIAAGEGYSMRPGGDSVEHFRSRFHRLESKSPDTFVIYRHSHRTEFTRGACGRGD